MARRARPGAPAPGRSTATRRIHGGHNHGHTPAAWTGVTIAFIGFCVAGAFTVLADPRRLLGRHGDHRPRRCVVGAASCGRGWASAAVRQPQSTRRMRPEQAQRRQAAPLHRASGAPVEGARRTRASRPARIGRSAGDSAGPDASVAGAVPRPAAPLAARSAAAVPPPSATSAPSTPAARPLPRLPAAAVHRAVLPRLRRAAQRPRPRPWRPGDRAAGQRPRRRLLLRALRLLWGAWVVRCVRGRLPAARPRRLHGGARGAGCWSSRSSGTCPFGGLLTPVTAVEHVPCRDARQPDARPRPPGGYHRSAR